jgi:heme-NO-binding protein
VVSLRKGTTEPSLGRARLPEVDPIPMKGIVFNLLEEAVVRQYGEDTWDDLLEAAGLDGVYTSLGSYPDQQLTDLVAAASAVTGTDPQSIIRWFGREAMPALAAAYPGFFVPHRDIGSFLNTLNEIIHPEVRKLYPGADVPTFGFTTASDGTITMRYGSPRRLCAFAEGLIEGAATQFGQVVTIDQPRCMLRGDELCAIEIRVGH